VRLRIGGRSRSGCRVLAPSGAGRRGHGRRRRRSRSFARPLSRGVRSATRRRRGARPARRRPGGSGRFPCRVARAAADPRRAAKAVALVRNRTQSSFELVLLARALEGELDLGPEVGEWCSQLVARVGDEAALSFHRRLEPAESGPSDGPGGYADTSANADTHQVGEH
jgi:hypothetical protein